MECVAHNKCSINKSITVVLSLLLLSIKKTEFTRERANAKSRVKSAIYERSKR